MGWILSFPTMWTPDPVSIMILPLIARLVSELECFIIVVITGTFVDSLEQLAAGCKPSKTVCNPHDCQDDTEEL